MVGLRRALAAGVLLGWAGAAVFVVLHFLLIMVTWFLLPAGLIVGGVGGLFAGAGWWAWRQDGQGRGWGYGLFAAVGPFTLMALHLAYGTMSEATWRLWGTPVQLALLAFGLAWGGWRTRRLMPSIALGLVPPMLAFPFSAQLLQSAMVWNEIVFAASIGIIVMLAGMAMPSVSDRLGRPLRTPRAVAPKPS